MLQLNRYWKLLGSVAAIGLIVVSHITASDPQWAYYLSLISAGLGFVITHQAPANAQMPQRGQAAQPPGLLAPLTQPPVTP